ncbi:DNA (cytosine-5-)-methyltransferase (TIGR00675) [uncultured Mediterranean phage uvMED]|nr:DNA (cytosine-5-)-methyltransferase (TIGR00675) [uncultured Mediterranean phage uvMED]
MNYYNENNKYASQWLKNLIREKLIPRGEVDERSIEDVQPEDLKGFNQCHFFAGIGGWAYALQLAGWDSNRPVWTGSCPCQSFSIAGQRKGANDKRNLWGQWFRLIRESKPATVFGEQVVGAIGFGWLDAVATDLEACDYRFASSVLSGYTVGAYHKRQRLWFVADTLINGRDESLPKISRKESKWNDGGSIVTTDGHMADTQIVECDDGFSGEFAETHEKNGVRGQVGTSSGVDKKCLADSVSEGLQGRVSGRSNEERTHLNGFIGHNSAVDWRAVEWVECGDGKTRPIPLEPDVQPLVNGVPEVMDSEGNPRKYNYSGSLKGIGNAIIPQVAAVFISSYLDI